MSLRLEMLQVARLGPKLLGDSTELMCGFFSSQLNEDGGFKDRSGRSDLYYTVFGIDGMLALQAPLPVNQIVRFLSGFGSGEGLDYVHLCCLAHCWGALGQVNSARCPASIRESILLRIEEFRAQDGGYNGMRDQHFGTAYGGFLALGAYQDLSAQLPEPLKLVQSLKFLETPDGAWANERGIKVGATNATSAAIVLLKSLGMPINAEVGTWLLSRFHPMGGLLASPATPVPDLLSTATALHALACLNCDIASLREKCLDFIDTLWTNEGGFYGHWADDFVDCEYSYYGLLALGHLNA